MNCYPYLRSISFLLVIFCSITLTDISAQTSQGGLISDDFVEMQLLKAQIGQGEEQALRWFNQFIEKADGALEEGPYSVMHKKGVPPSGDKHDYMSLGPYWWPNPDSPDGLPYIRKDGEINPEARDDHTDFVEKQRFFEAVDLLGKAYFFSQETKYARKVVSLLRAWFIDTATAMNPHLEYGQSIPGLIDGRPFGIIEFMDLISVITTMQLLELTGAPDFDTRLGVKTWLQSYSEWLQMSKLGRREGTRGNNHGTTYDVQLCAILLYLGETEQVRHRLEKVSKNSIAQQIEADGRQPRELERTKAFSYSTTNLSALTKLAWFGKQVGIDLWNFETEDGRSIKRAYEFLIPYLTTDKKWEYQQIAQRDTYRSRFARLLLETGKKFGVPTYVEIAKNYLENR